VLSFSIGVDDDDDDDDDDVIRREYRTSRDQRQRMKSKGLQWLITNNPPVPYSVI
jgi:hypothetical protein